jgi:recombination associated protein RdgC
MFFRNVTMFRFPAGIDFSDLETGLAELALKPVGALELSSRGFISPFGRDHTELLRRQGDFIWIAAGSEEKIMPGSVVNDALAKKVKQIEETEGRKLGGKARKRLKEDLVHEMLPKAFVKPGRTDAVIDTKRGVIYVDTASRRAGEAVVSDLRHALGSFPALPLNAEAPPRCILTGWLQSEPMPEILVLGDEAELRDPTDNGAKVKMTGQELESDEITQHLDAGKQASRLALTMGDSLSFVFGEDLIIRKLRFLDGAMERLNDENIEDFVAELDARLALQNGELTLLFETLEKAFQFSRADADAKPAEPKPTAEAVFKENVEEAAQRVSQRDAEDVRMSDREWAAQPAGLRDGATTHVAGVGDL